jgi:hypothetical protein
MRAFLIMAVIASTGAFIRQATTRDTWHAHNLDMSSPWSRIADSQPVRRIVRASSFSAPGAAMPSPARRVARSAGTASSADSSSAKARGRVRVPARAASAAISAAAFSAA